MPKKKRQPGEKPTKEEQAELLREIGEPDESVKAKQEPGYDIGDFLSALNRVADGDPQAAS